MIILATLVMCAFVIILVLKLTDKVMVIESIPYRFKVIIILSSASLMLTVPFVITYLFLR